MADAAQVQPPTKLPAYVTEWVGARVEVLTSRGREHGTVSEARKFRGTDAMVVRLNVLLDSGGLKYAFATEVIRIASPSKTNMEIAAHVTSLAANATETGSNGEVGSDHRNADKARDSV